MWEWASHAHGNAKKGGLPTHCPSGYVVATCSLKAVTLPTVGSVADPDTLATNWEKLLRQYHKYLHNQHKVPRRLTLCCWRAQALRSGGDGCVDTTRIVAGASPGREVARAGGPELVADVEEGDGAASPRVPDAQVEHLAVQLEHLPRDWDLQRVVAAVLGPPAGLELGVERGAVLALGVVALQPWTHEHECQRTCPSIRCVSMWLCVHFASAERATGRVMQEGSAGRC